jgi:hypothetical protein
MSNYPDNIHQYDSHLESPFYEEPQPELNCEDDDSYDKEIEYVETKSD